MSNVIARLSTALEGRYHVEAELGEGGMATVYLAEDLRHERQVALKVLKPVLAAIVGAERFLAEIKTTANLQHPHILALYDSGQADRFLYYVMPYIDGETLKDRLAREAQLPVEEAIRLASDIAEALQAAHDAGVVHRDIKPANILLSKGRPLVADFGISLALTAAGGGRITETGLSLGTPTYMSPEQASGNRTLDGRADVYSLAAVTYEMLVGRPPFEAASVPALMAKVLTDPVPLIRQERPSVPDHVEAAVQRALSKLPADRFSSASEFGRALIEPGYRTTTTGAKRARWEWGVLSTSAALLALAALLVWFPRGPTDLPGVASRTSISLPEDRSLVFGENSRPLAISRDGTKVAYVGLAERGTQLYERRIDEFMPRAIESTEGATQPAFSPDGQWLAYLARGRLWKIPVSGGVPFEIANVGRRVRGISWGPRDTLIYALPVAGLFAVPAEGGDPVALPALVATGGASGGDLELNELGDPRDRLLPAWPFVLEGGEHALVSTTSTYTGNADVQGTWVVELRSGEAGLVEGHPAFASTPIYLKSGHVMYADGDANAFVIPFDLATRETRGSGIGVIEDLARGSPPGAWAYAVADNGTLVFPTHARDGDLVLVDRSGRETPIDLQRREYRFPAFAPDGVRVAVTGDDQQWIVDTRRPSEVLFRAGAYQGLWGPGADQLIFWSSPGIMRSDLSGETAIVHAGGALPSTMPPWPQSWSSQGDRLLITVVPAETSNDVWVVDLGDATAPTPFLVTPFSERTPVWSPDGRWVAYVSDASGDAEVYIAPYPGPGAPERVSTSGGQDPVWRGDEIFFRQGKRIMVVDIETEPTLDIGEAVELFRGDYDFLEENNWDVSFDGRQFVMVRGDPTTTRELKVVTNWLAELRTPN